MSWDDVSRSDLERHWRGAVYLARLRLNRLQGAWHVPAQRTDRQNLVIRQHRTILAATILAARRERVVPFWKGNRNVSS